MPPSIAATDCPTTSCWCSTRWPTRPSTRPGSFWPTSACSTSASRSGCPRARPRAIVCLGRPRPWPARFRIWRRSTRRPIARARPRSRTSRPRLRPPSAAAEPAQENRRLPSAAACPLVAASASSAVEFLRLDGVSLDALTALIQPRQNGAARRQTVFASQPEEVGGFGLVLGDALALHIENARHRAGVRLPTVAPFLQVNQSSSLVLRQLLTGRFEDPQLRTVRPHSGVARALKKGRAPFWIPGHAASF